MAQSVYQEDGRSEAGALPARAVMLAAGNAMG